MGFQAREPLPAGLQTVPPEDRVDARGADAPATPQGLPQLQGEAGRPLRRPQQRVGQDRMLERGDRLPGPAGRPRRPGAQPLGPIAQIASAPPVEERPRNAGLPTGLGHTAKQGGALQDRQAMTANAVLEGHAAPPPPSETGQVSVGGFGGWGVTLFS